jgi:hypothetical protein
MLKLEEITQTEETILFDNSVSSNGRFIWETYNVTHPEEICAEELTEALKIHQDFFAFLTQPNTSTIEGVREQYKEFLNILSGRMAFYDHVAKKTKRTPSQEHETYRQLGKIANKNLKKLAKKIYEPIRQQQYQPLQQLVNTLDINRSSVSQTNKNLVATALYAANIDRRQTAIISGNEHTQTLIEKLRQQNNNGIKLYIPKNDTYTLF